MQEHIAVGFVSYRSTFLIQIFVRTLLLAINIIFFEFTSIFRQFVVTRAVRFSYEFVPGLRMVLNKTRVTFYEIVHRSNDVFTIERLNA